MTLAEGSYFRDLNASWDMSNRDMSNPNASSSASMSSPYRTGDYYTVSGRSNTGVGLGKIITYGLLGLAGYWLYKRIKG